jgi:hypothetical protein
LVTVTQQIPPLPSARDRHLFGPGPKRILSLDGGGVKGALSIAFLERLEKVVEEIEGKPVLLGDWFDLIGGTSTGAIIGCALALGYRASDIHSFYNSLSNRIFNRSPWRFAGLQAKFDARNLMKELATIIGERTLETEDLRTGFAIMTKRLDTGSPWIIMNNPKSQYWDTPADGSFTGNRHYLLANLVRASTAAPYYFDPQSISVAPNTRPGLFVDGGFSPHNNPSLYLFLMASLPQFRLSWPSGPENLTIVSIGTGRYRPTMTQGGVPWLRTIGLTVHALAGQISDSEEFVLALMSWLGESPTKWTINSELGNLSEVASPNNQPLFRFLRYNVSLEHKWLEEELGLKIEEATLDSYRCMDRPRNIPALYRLGVQAAEKQIRVQDLAPQPATRP